MNKQIFIASLLALTLLFVGNVYAKAQNGPQGMIQVQLEGSQQVNSNSNNGSDAGMQIQQQNQVNLQDDGLQNQVQNQGDNQQIQKVQQQGIMTQARSQVANAVQEMLQVAERNGGIGEQIRVIAQNQNQNQEKIENSLLQVQSRKTFTKFIVGPNYGEINNAQKMLEQNRQNLEQLNQIRNQIVDQVDSQQLLEQIQVLEQANLEIEDSLESAQKGFSLFGWLFKVFSR